MVEVHVDSREDVDSLVVGGPGRGQLSTATKNINCHRATEHLDSVFGLFQYDIGEFSVYCVQIIYVYIYVEERTNTHSFFFFF